MLIGRALIHFPREILNDSDVLNEIDVNPLQLCESIEFKKPYKLGVEYRQKAIDSVIEKKLEFCSTFNSTYELAGRYLQIICPYCKMSMKLVNGGGNADAFHLEYKCEDCKAKSFITLQSGDWSFSPPLS